MPQIEVVNPSREFHILYNTSLGMDSAILANYSISALHPLHCAYGGLLLSNPIDFKQPGNSCTACCISFGKGQVHSRLIGSLPSLYSTCKTASKKISFYHCF
jgi:hypothetical protein